MANGQFICDLIVNVNGSTVSAQMRYRHRSGGSFAYHDQNFPAPTMTIDGQVFRDTGFQGWVQRGINVGDVRTTNFSKECSNGGNITVTFSAGRGYRSDFEGSWSKTVSVTPTATSYGLSVTLVNAKWNYVTTKVAYTTLNGGNFRYIEGKILTADSTGYWPEEGVCKGRYLIDTEQNNPRIFYLNNEDASEKNGAINIRGCLAFKIAGGIFATNGSQRHLSPTIYYTPPAPLTELAVASQAYVSNNKTNITLKIVGGNSVNNNDVSVETEFRYQVDGGDWSSWTSAGSGKPWVAKTPNFTVNAGSYISVQARQKYQSSYSEIKTLSLGSYKVPQNVSIKANTITDNSIQITARRDAIGYPTSGPANIIVGVFTKNNNIFTELARRSAMAKTTLDRTDYTFTITNNGPMVGSPAFTINPNTKYYIGVYSGNLASGWASQSGDGRGQAYDYVEVYTSPSKPELVYVDSIIDPASGSGNYIANLRAVLPTLGGGAFTLTPKYRYSTNGGISWSNWNSLSPNTLSQDFSIAGLAPNTTVILEAKTDGVRDSSISTITFKTGQEVNLVTSLTWSFDELRRKNIIWKLKTGAAYAIAKNATLTIKGHTVELMANDTATVVEKSESLPETYTPNETLEWTLTVSTNSKTETLEGQITMPRPILGIMVNSDGTKKYITDIVQAGGDILPADDFKLDAGYRKMKII